MERRKFLKTGAAGLAAIGILGADLREVLGGTGMEPHEQLIEASIGELQARMRAGRLTARRLTEMYIDRIKEIDVRTRSVVEINPDALAIADRLDAERKRGRIRSAMHGIPILLKDNIDTADKMLTTAGSLALVDAPRPKADAFVVKRLREAGAVILGKANLSEWANFRGNRSVSGWSARGGQTNNPYFLDQNPCGSSSGSGVSVSANLAAGAVGTETNGSIICPAVTNGVVGLKPTLGMISRSGIIPIAHTQDTAGPMTRTVANAAIMLTAMVGRDRADSITAAADKYASKDYARFLDPNGLKEARLGVVTQYIQRPELREFYQQFIAKLEDGGATTIEVKFEPNFSDYSADRLNVLLYEFKHDLNKYLGARGSKYKTLEDLIKFNEENKERQMPLFGQELFIQAQEKGGLDSEEYTSALARVKSSTREDGIDKLVTENRLDALVGPTTGALWSIPAVAGYPSITVPLGLRENSAVGMLFFGKAFSEPALIKYAYAFEQITRGRSVPQFLSTYPKKEGS
jgi:amidase